MSLDEKNLNSLGANFAKLSSSQVITDSLVSTLQEITLFANATGFSLKRYLPDTAMLVDLITIEGSTQITEPEYPGKESDSLMAWSVMHRSPVIINDATEDFHLYRPDRIVPENRETTGSFISIPLLKVEGVAGVFILYHPHKKQFIHINSEILKIISGYLASLIECDDLTSQMSIIRNELDAAREQLLESERMASLGQLTAGIAHEIKNPLNFVNNFAEITVDLVNELEDELGKLSGSLSTKEMDYLLEIMGDIKSNAIKINDHGKRADSIVKGMLLHSRGKGGERQPADINSILAEYVNLAYHAMRAQDNSFNIKIESDYDPTIGLINIIQQDISRVFLNIINNACYSTNKKKQQLKEAYFPVLTVTTRNLPDHVLITIRDNGTGIPGEVLDKIFNPFFTTKPPGEGTGLGLSLSYDIIVKEHLGEMKVNSEVNEYAEFIITIPKKI
jgi:signal transduction histidine kinase